VSDQVAEAPVEAPADTPQDAAPVVEAAIETPAAPLDADAQLDSEAIEIPTGEKLVPLSAVTRLRAELKEVKGQAKEAAELRQKLQETQGNLQAAQPYIEAAREMIERQRQAAAQPQPPQGPTDEDVAELTDVARLLDFYTPEGAPDLSRAQKHLALVERAAERRARAATEPLVQQSLAQQASHMRERAKATKLGNGDTADADIIDALWGRIEQQPGGLQTLANKEAVKHLWGQAYALTKMRQAQNPAPAKVDAPPDPLFSERAGGRTGGSVTLTDGDKRVARDLGMTDAQYAKELEKMPAGWGGRK